MDDMKFFNVSDDFFDCFMADRHKKMDHFSFEIFNLIRISTSKKINPAHKAYFDYLLTNLALLKGFRLRIPLVQKIK